MRFWTPVVSIEPAMRVALPEPAWFLPIPAYSFSDDHGHPTPEKCNKIGP
jgi:hypothetical protein